MPPLTRLRIGALADLAQQLRFAPPQTLRRQTLAAEALAREIDPARNYSLAALARRLTGFRFGAGASGEGSSDADETSDELIIGAALARELSALVERLSDRAGFTLDDLGPGALTLGALCRRWGVDRKTIERRRREGLIAFRVSAPGEPRARKRLAFRLEAVERFERAAGVVPVAAPGPRAVRRVSRAEADRLSRLGERCRRRFGWTLHTTAARLAAHTGRSTDAVRRALSRSASARVFDERAPLRARERAVIERALRRGVPAAALATRFARTRASIHRAALEARGAMLRGLDLSGPVAATFTRPDAAEVLLAPTIVRAGLDTPWESVPAAFAASARGARPPDAESEFTLAAAAAYLRFAAARRIAALPEHGPAAGAIDEIETMLRWCALARVRLARMDLRLALLTIEERIGGPLESLPPADARTLCDAARSALLAGARAFDPFRSGARLAAAVTAALTRALAQPAARDAIGRAASGGRAGAGRRAGVASGRINAEAWCAWLDPPPGLRGLVEARAVDVEDGAYAALRFCWGVGVRASAPPMTRVDAIGALGRSMPWAAQAERRLMRAGLGLPATVRVRPGADSGVKLDPERRRGG